MTKEDCFMLEQCSIYLPEMIDPINKALSGLSQRPALTKGLLRYLRERKENETCPGCGRDQLDHVLTIYRNGSKSDCRDCTQAGISLCNLIPPSSDPFERKLQANVIGGIHRFGLKHHLVPAAPIMVTWELTTQCNMGTCRHCHIKAETHGGSDSELTSPEAKGVVDQLADWGIGGIAFTGGECLMRPDFLELLGYATSRGLACYMATNGLLLTPDTIRALKKAGLCLVHISLDGSNEQTHDYFRGYPGSFAQVMKSTKDCLGQGLQVALAATPTRVNASEMRDMLQLADSLQVDWFITYNYIPAGRGGVELDLDIRQKDQLWSDLLEEAGHCRKTRWLPFAPQLSIFGKIIGLNDKLSTTHYYEPLFASSYQTMLRSSTACMAGRYYLAIKADGRVVPCIFLPEEVGNVRNHKLADLWSDSQVLENLRDHDRIEGFCDHCAYSTSCGGCRARARAYTGNYMASDPHCPVAARLAMGARPIHEANVGDYLHQQGI